jgi:hypothetical protein
MAGEQPREIAERSALDGVGSVISRRSMGVLRAGRLHRVARIQ